MDGWHERWMDGWHEQHSIHTRYPQTGSHHPHLLHRDLACSATAPRSMSWQEYPSNEQFKTSSIP
jgi:hypothetical protein